MPRVSHSVLVMYSAEQMYDLVNDIESYAKFLPGCVGGCIVRNDGEQLDATLDVVKAGFRYRLSTRNRMIPGVSIEMRLLQGPFKRFHGTWTFHQLGVSGCKVSLDVEFEISGKLTQATLGRLTEQMITPLVDAFGNRAKQIYG